MQRSKRILFEVGMYFKYYRSMLTREWISWSHLFQILPDFHLFCILYSSEYLSAYIQECETSVSFCRRRSNILNWHRKCNILQNLNRRQVNWPFEVNIIGHPLQLRSVYVSGVMTGTLHPNDVLWSLSIMYAL